MAGRYALGDLGRAYALLGRRDDAHKVIATLVRQAEEPGLAGVPVALVHTGLGDAGSAMEWLARASRDGRRLPFHIRVLPQWDVVRSSPDFDEFQKEYVIAGK